ncbi:MAG TPA: zf-HC2 domain-containing protein [Aliidongia sp.]|nr:zf-HC2 domain-containing protein [Aliidongia sp.]
MKCADRSLLVDLALDDELDMAGLAEFERHLQSCPDCAVAYARKKALKDALCAQLPRHRASSALVQRICEARKRFANEAAPTIARQEAPLSIRNGDALRSGAPSQAGGRLRMAISGVGGALAAGLIAALLMHETPEKSMVQAIVESHVGALLSGRLLDVASGDPETIRPWLTGRSDVTPPVRNLAGSGFDLVGARLEYIANRRAAALVYRHHEHVLTLYVFSTPNAPVSSSEAVLQQGYAVCHWSRRGVTRWIVSDLDPRELEEFEELIAD